MVLADWAAFARAVARRVTPSKLRRSGSLDVPDLPSNVAPVDLTDAFCGPERCEAVEGNVLIYRDTDHLSSSYARALQLHVRDAIYNAFPGLFD